MQDRPPSPIYKPAPVIRPDNIARIAPAPPDILAEAKALRAARDHLADAIAAAIDASDLVERRLRQIERLAAATTFRPALPVAGAKPALVAVSKGGAA